MATGSILVYLMYFPQRNQTDSRIEVLSIDTIQARVSSESEDDITAGLKLFDKQVEARASDKDRQELLLYEADFALQTKRYDKAFEIATKADAIDSNAATAMRLGRIYEAKGDKKQALSYYKKALSGQKGRSGLLLQQKILELEQ